MKAYTKVATPQRIPTNSSPSQMAEMLNKILPDLARQTNNAVDSLTGSLVDSGAWFQGQRVEVVADRSQCPDKTDDELQYTDIIVPHRLGRIPTEWWIVDSEQMVFSADLNPPNPPLAITPMGTLWRSPTAWTATNVFFRTTGNNWLCGMRHVVYLIA